MTKIIKVIPSSDYLIAVHFENNHKVIIDMKGKLHTARFSDLRSEAVFCLAITDGRAIHWPGGISIAISEIMEIIIK